MQRKEIKSSFIESIGHNEETDTLEVAFKDGNIYRYIGVPADLHESVIGAESIGKAFHQHILKAGFHMEKVKPEDSE